MSGKNPLTMSGKDPLTMSLSKGRHGLDLACSEPAQG